MNFKKLGGAETRINHRQSLEIACVYVVCQVICKSNHVVRLMEHMLQHSSWEKENKSVCPIG